jgi:hypothetical protein
MTKKFFALLLLSLSASLPAQQKYALVIGNGSYANLSRLANPANDANDMAAALAGLGFTVDKVLDGSLNDMENAIMRLKNRLSVSKNSYGFLFYAGHGVQSGGVNYLIPATASIPGENYLRERAVSVQAMMSELNDAGNELNVVVLDACRDNPFGWARSGSRGLSVLSNQPADSIIVYATSAGATASDGKSRNGLFTGCLLKNLKTPGLEVAEVFRLTGSEVARASERQQIPAVYKQFFGTAYLGPQPLPPSIFKASAANVATGALEITTITAGKVQIIGAQVNKTALMPAYGSLPIEEINSGVYRVIMEYENGKKEEKKIEVGRSENVKLDFSYHVPLPAPKPEKPAKPAPVKPAKPEKPAPEPAPVKPAKPEPGPKERQPLDPQEYRLNSVGASVGTSFAAPWLVGSAHGTYSPWDRSFFKLGVDVGMASGVRDTGYYSIYPFAHYAFFMPVAPKTGWYAGAGGGCMIARYKFPEGLVKLDIFALDVTAGVTIANAVDVSYTFRTDFRTISNKVAVGYVYRF